MNRKTTRNEKIKSGDIAGASAEKTENSGSSSQKINIPSFDTQKIDSQVVILPTPIGNLHDVNFRFFDVIDQVDIVVCEDTRNFLGLCKKLNMGVKAKLISYHDHSYKQKADYIISLIEQGNRIAIVSDAGMPLISDPGYKLIRECIKKNFSVTCTAGASAFIIALVLSGFSTDKFSFYGFLPVKHNAKLDILKSLSKRSETLIFYESANRIEKTILDMREVFGGERRVCIARELTKKFEETIRGSIDEVLTKISDIRGEICIVVEGKNKQNDSIGEDGTYGEASAAISLDSVVDEIADIGKMGDVKTKSLIKYFSEKYNIPKNKLYDAVTKRKSNFE